MKMELCPLLTPPAPTPSRMRQYKSWWKMSAPPTLPSKVSRALPAAPVRSKGDKRNNRIVRTGCVHSKKSAES